MTSRYNARTDANHAAIRAALRDEDKRKWRDTFRYGSGFPDCICFSWSGIPVVAEIKMPGEVLTAAEQRFWDWYTGPKEIFTSPEQARARMTYWDQVSFVIPREC